MAGRRAEPRFVLQTPWPGELRIVRGVTVTTERAGELTVMSQHPYATGEELWLELMSGIRRATAHVRVRQSQPVVDGGVVKHRLQVEVMRAEPSRSTVIARSRVRREGRAR